MEVTVAKVAAEPVDLGFNLLATVKSQRSAAVQPQVEGNITQIFVRSGDRVAQGQPLMQIEASRQVAAVQSSKAALTSRQAAAAFAKDQFERMKKVVEGGGASAQDLETARAAMDTAKAELSATEANLSAQQMLLDYYRVTAPAPGVIGDIPVHRGDRVTPMQVLTTIEQNEGLEIYAPVPIERAEEVHVGSRVLVLDGDGSVLFESKLHFVSPHVAEETQTVLCKAALQPAKKGTVLRANTSVIARITTSEAPRIRVPTRAVTRLNGQPFVYVATAGKAALKPVELGELLDDRFVVEKGLAAGDELITSGVQKLRDGAPIVAANAAPAAKGPSGPT